MNSGFTGNRRLPALRTGLFDSGLTVYKHSLRLLEMKKLNATQHYGLLALIGGICAQLGIAMLFPSYNSLWLLAWSIAFIGAITYVVGTIPGIREWVKRISGL